MSSVTDLKIASMAAGFSLGFEIWTVWTAYRQTKQIRNPWKSMYIFMVWGSILINFTMIWVAWFFLNGNIKANIVTFFFMLVLWVFQIQFIMQIIINRVSVVVEDRRDAVKLKWGTAALITCINIAVFCIWIPAHLQVNETYMKINNVWDRCSKAIICLVDAALNLIFVIVVKRRLISHGLNKYQKLVTFNFRLMAISMSMDVMLIGMMFLKNGGVYLQFHPLAYLVKLNIEMSMATLIRKIASDQSDFQLPDTLSHLDDLTTSTNSHARQHSRSSHKPSMSIGGAAHNGSMNIHTKKDFIVETRSIPDVDLESNVSARDLHAQRSNMGSSVGLDNDDRPLKPGDGTTWKMGNQSRVDTQV